CVPAYCLSLRPPALPAIYALSLHDALPICEGARPRVASADDVDQLARRALPVEVAVGAPEPRRERRALWGLGLGRQLVETLARLDDHVGAERGQPTRQRAGGLLGVDPAGLRQERRPGVHALVHLERRDA